MADVVQLNLFGDFIGFDEHQTVSKEVENGTQSLGTNGPSALGAVSPETVSGIEGKGNTGTGIGESGGVSQGHDGGLGGAGHAEERSPGDRSASIHSPSPGTGISGNSGIDPSLKIEGTEYKATDRVQVGSGGFGTYTGTITKVYMRRDELRLRIKKDDGGFADEGRFSMISKLNPEPSKEPVESPTPSPSLPRSPGTLRNGHTDDRGNYHITDEDLIGKGGKVAKFEANLAAIELLNELSSEKRYATPEEQSILVKYTGWGGLSEVFKKDLEGPWLDRQNALKAALTPEEYASASRSTLNAHYSDPQIIDSIWTAVTRMGYNGGPTLEPATGVGHFFGKRPENLPIEMHGIELDSVSGRIAQQLYQSADIKITGYEDIRMPDSRYNLIISNVPFGDYKPYEEKRNRTPGLDNRYSIHDFYFLKSLHGVREGGLIAFITSRYTLDKLDTEVRENIAQKADFIGAIRLPNNAFTQIADTEVVTDIVFLQKRSPSQEMSDQTKRFIDTGSITLESPDGPVSFAVNQYFIDHPEMVLGSPELTGTMYSSNEYTVSLKDDSLKLRLESAVSNLPENIMNVFVDEKTKQLDDSINLAISHIDTDILPRGSFIVGSDNRLYQKGFDTGTIEPSRLYRDESKNADTILRIMLMSSIRDCVKEAIEHYHSGQQLEVSRDLSRLNSLYDNFVKEHGFLNAKRNIAAFYDDPDSSLLQSLEIWNAKTKTATKAEIFDGITFVRKESPTFVESPVDAMVLSLSRYGRLNMPYMESLTGNERNVLVTTLISSGHIFQDPYDYVTSNRTTYLTSDEYLSGNIREKLKYAQLAAEKDPATFSRNIQELSRILPKELGPQDISLRLNSPIIGKEHVKDFVSDLLNLRSDLIDVIHVSITGKWEIKAQFKYVSTENFETYGTRSMPAIDIINALMNGKPIKVYTRGSSTQPPVLDQEATSAAELKAEAINTAFAKWLWRDQDRTDDIVKRYNEVYNSHVERTFTHPERMSQPDAKIWMHGCNFPYPLRPHQADAVWRVLQNKNTMLAHTVGAGKTVEMACSAMELRRLGLRSKPMIVCPDHMIGQWASEFRQAYPAAKLLVADDNNWDKDNRRTFINKIATGDWDAVIIRAESFKMIPMSDEYQRKFFEAKVAEYKQILDETDSAHRKSRSVKDLEKAIEKYEDKIKELSDAHRDEGVIPFDKLGVDHLFIDEADIYKNLEYYTQLQNVRGLGTPKGSERAIDMMMKIRHVQEQDGGITFATGTPISNTLVEAYTMQRFLQPEVLKANGLEAFDEWARQYAETITQMELNNTGTGYSPVTRFSKIVNVPELVSSLRQSWDIQTAQNLEKNGILVPGVNLPRMKIINEAAPSTPLLQSYLKHLEERERNLSGKPEQGKDNVLSIMTDGRKAAIDMRFINPYFPDDPNSKLNLAVKVIASVYTRYKVEGYTCAVFFDKARSFDSSGTILFDGVQDIKRKLIDRGVSPSEIGDVRDCKTFEQRQELFERVRDGKCRVIFGSTETMGAGTNFQRYLKAIVHVDAPWRPRDIEQQNGRGYRPGNKTGELEVYNLVTKGSLDTGLWNVLETKANSIRQVMDGSDKNTRQIEENYYGSVKELSIDNDLMKEAVELDHSLRKLRSYERSFNNDIAHAHRRMQSIPEEIKRAEEHSAKIVRDVEARVPENKIEKFTMTLEGRVFDKRQEAGEFLKAEASTLCLQAKAAGRDIEKPIGEYLGIPLVIRSTIHDAISSARLSACAPNFRYSAEIRPDSSPERLPVTLHSQIYKGMDKMLEDSQKNIQTLRKSLADYTANSKATFPKAEELRSKEIRYTEVMATLKKQAEERPKQEENHNDIPWKKIAGMSGDEIRECIRIYYDSVKYQAHASTVSDMKNATDISNSVKGSHSISLPPSVISLIDSALSSGSLKPDATHNLICSSIDSFRSQGYEWKKENNPPGIHAVFAKDKENVTQGDICVRLRPVGNEQSFEAFKIIDPNNSKFLGSEKSFEAIRERVEQYVTCLYVRDKISETIALSKNADRVQEQRPSYGLDI